MDLLSKSNIFYLTPIILNCWNCFKEKFITCSTFFFYCKIKLGTSIFRDMKIKTFSTIVHVHYFAFYDHHVISQLLEVSIVWAYRLSWYIHLRRKTLVFSLNQSPVMINIGILNLFMTHILLKRSLFFRCSVATGSLHHLGSVSMEIRRAILHIQGLPLRMDLIRICADHNRFYCGTLHRNMSPNNGTKSDATIQSFQMHHLHMDYISMLCSALSVSHAHILLSEWSKD